MTTAAESRDKPAQASFEEPLISIGEASLDRMPALSSIFEEAAAAFTKLIEEYSEIPTALSFEDIDAKRVGELQDHCAALTTVLVYQSSGLESKLVAAVDRGFRDLSVELLLGSSIVDPVADPDRQTTHIEASLVEFAVGRFLDGLRMALAPIVDVRFARDQFFEEAAFGAIGQKAAVAILFRYKLKAFDHEGQLAVALPRSALDPFRAALSRLPGGEGVAQDERWSDHLYDHIARTELKVHVTIESRELTLDDVSRFAIGDIVRLPISPTSPIRIESDGRTLFWCTLGQKDGFYTVRLEEFSDERQEFLQDLLGV
jgi:flagellar motor switch protein FliM